MDRHINAPLDAQTARELRAGDYVYITGTIYTARDAAHLRMDKALNRGEQLPVSLENNSIYNMGPSPAREGRHIWKDARSDRQVQQRQAVWISMRPDYWILD